MGAIAHQGIPVSSQCSTDARRANVISENASRERERTREELISLLKAPHLHSHKGSAHRGDSAEKGMRTIHRWRTCAATEELSLLGKARP